MTKKLWTKKPLSLTRMMIGRAVIAPTTGEEYFPNYYYEWSDNMAWLGAFERLPMSAHLFSELTEVCKVGLLYLGRRNLRRQRDKTQQALRDDNRNIKQKNKKQKTKITHSGKAKHLRARMIWNSTNIWGKLKLVQLPLPVEVSYKSLNNASDLCISP